MASNTVDGWKWLEKCTFGADWVMTRDLDDVVTSRWSRFDAPSLDLAACPRRVISLPSSIVYQTLLLADGDERKETKASGR